MSRFARPRLALLLAAVMAIPATAQAEGLFGAILNFLGGGRPAQEQPAPPPPQQPFPSASNPLDRPGLNSQPVPPSRGGQQVAYCVRTCDGRYFPMPRNTGANATPAKICGAMCPTAETKIYFGNAIENAVAADGNRYSSLKNAFLYREKLVEGCSCNGGDATGNTPIDIRADPTLHSGDIVVTGNGPMVFKAGNGGKGDARKRGELAPTTDAKLSAIKVARPGNAPIASPQNVVHAPVAAAKGDTVSPVARVNQIFDFKDFDDATPWSPSALGYNGQQ
jgi:Protein of unknown function (DUF2865)